MYLRDVKYKDQYMDGPVVVKLWFGRKYFIWKFLNLYASSRKLLSELVKKMDKKPKADDLFLPVVEHQHKVKEPIMMVEVLYTSGNLPSVLVYEQNALNKATGDKNCLNLNKVPYMPKWATGEGYGSTIKKVFAFTLIGKHRTAPAVLKLWIGDKFFIYKCKSIYQTVDALNSSFERKCRSGCLDTDLFSGAVRHAVMNNIHEGKIEVILKTPIKAELIAFEKKLLEKSFGKPDCLNISSQQYIPKWLSA